MGSKDILQVQHKNLVEEIACNHYGSNGSIRFTRHCSVAAPKGDFLPVVAWHGPPPRRRRPGAPARSAAIVTHRRSGPGQPGRPSGVLLPDSERKSLGLNRPGRLRARGLNCRKAARARRAAGGPPVGSGTDDPPSPGPCSESRSHGRRALSGPASRTLA